MEDYQSTDGDAVLAFERLDFSRADTLDEFMALSQPVNSMKKALSNNLYGFNHQGLMEVLPDNKDNEGLVFFTRPNLNMTASNIRNVRHFYNLLTTESTSIHRYIRCLLDPLQETLNGVKSDLLDNSSAFIPVLSNNFLTMSGWPDMTMENYDTPAGVRKEQMSIADSTTDLYQSYDLDCTFRNTQEEPIILMMQTWLMYMGLVFEDVLAPYNYLLVANEMDYNTRIYRIILDESQTYVKKIAATGASFPVNVPMGKFFDKSGEKPYTMTTKEINIRFKCNGAIYNDPLLIHIFNMHSIIFNPELKAIIKAGYNSDSSHPFEVIPGTLSKIFNFRGYPLINPDTMSLDWWISTESLSYKYIMRTIDEKIKD